MGTDDHSYLGYIMHRNINFPADFSHYLKLCMYFILRCGKKLSRRFVLNIGTRLIYFYVCAYYILKIFFIKILRVVAPLFLPLWCIVIDSTICIMLNICVSFIYYIFQVYLFYKLTSLNPLISFLFSHRKRLWFKLNSLTCLQLNYAIRQFII